MASQGYVSEEHNALARVISEQDQPQYDMMANAIRALSMDAVETARSGHPGMPMGMADVATVLFSEHLKFDASCPDWPDRDRFVLSAGHGSMLLYALLYLTGYEDMTLHDLKSFRQVRSKTAGHPEDGHAGGIETTTGPLGQGLATAVGMAIAEEGLAALFGRSLVDHRTYVIAGDGCLMEGVSQESIALAGHLRLSRLTVLWDDNRISIDGPVSLSDSTDQAERFSASGWDVLSCDGHDLASVNAALMEARGSSRPTLVACRTEIGFGAPSKAGTKGAHGAPLGADEISGARIRLDWPHAPFEIPGGTSEAWRSVGRRGTSERLAWESRLRESDPEIRADFQRRLAGHLPSTLAERMHAFKAEQVVAAPAMATRKASELSLEVINEVVPDTLGGSADLTGSNNTLTTDLGIFDADNRSGRYLHYGIREHGMAAAMNGISLHGGFVPYGGTFLVFSDYARPAIRLSALMGLRVIYVLTHDSIGLGEDGPTHQPIEHLAMLRATPNLQVFRPADVIETAEAWELALRSERTPSVLALSRQSVATVRDGPTTENLSEMGAYVIAEADGSLDAILLSTGSEVGLALRAREALQIDGIGCRVVSMPCWELFESQPDSYRKSVLPEGPVRVAVEAAIGFGWERWLCFNGGAMERSAFVGMNGFGASGPAVDLYTHFGITTDAVENRVRELVE